MLIVEKLYKLSDFTPSPDGNYLNSTLIYTVNITNLYNAVAALTNLTAKDLIMFNNLPNFTPPNIYITFGQWQNLSYLFDTYIGNQCVQEYPKF